MTEQQPAYTPPKKKRSYSLWIAGVVAVVGVVLIVLATPETPPPVADSSLEPGLLVSADFAQGFYVSNMAQYELDALPSAPALPDTVNPPECGELLRTTDQEGGKPVAVVEASDARTNTVYAQAIMRADDVSGWDPRRSDVLLSKCAGMTVSSGKGVSVSVTVAKVPGIVGEGYATSVTTGMGGFTMAVAMTKVGDHIVMFVGARVGSVFDETEFVRLANAANSRVRTRL